MGIAAFLLVVIRAMKRSCFALVLITAAFGEVLPKQADLAKLDDVETSFQEAVRLCGRDHSNWILERAWFFKDATERPETIYTLLGQSRPVRSKSDAFSADYLVENPETLFDGMVPTKKVIRTPGLTRIEGVVTLFFDSVGRELKPFGAMNYLSSGYVFDLNQDGILEKVEIDEVRDIERWKANRAFLKSIQIDSIARNPQTIFRAVFDPHSIGNAWDFTCRDIDGDGVIELVNGPRTGIDEELIYRWDKTEGGYLAKEGASSAVRVLKKEEEFDKVVMEFELSNTSRKTSDDKVVPVDGEEGYRFESLEGKSHEEYRAFFDGAVAADFESTEFGDPEDDQLPDGFWEMDAKAAALALAEHCRSEEHRTRFRIAVDDREGLKAPQSGWYVHRYRSDGSYSFRGLTCALRYGVEEPFLLVREENSAGMVGRNPWADESNFRVREIALSHEEAGFLSGVIFWLDRVRTTELRKKAAGGGFGTSGDGFVTLASHPDGEESREIGSGTAWDVGTVKARWRNEYDRDVMVNLVDLLIKEALYEKWSDLGGDADEGIRPNEKLVSSIRAICVKNQTDPVPPEFLERLIAVVAEDGLVALNPEVKRLQDSISKEATDEEKELSELQKRFARDHFGTPLRDDPNDHPEDFNRKEVLEEKLRFDRGKLLRWRLKLAEDRLSLVENVDRMMTVADGNVRDSEWALAMLRKREVNVWLSLMMGRFHEAGQTRRSGIFREVAEVDPGSARLLVSQMNKKIFDELLLEVTEFRLEHFPEEASNGVPDLLKILRNRKLDKILRIEAFDLLARLSRNPGQETALRELVVAEIENPQTKDIYYSTERAAFLAFEKLKPMAGDLDYLWSLQKFAKLSLERGIALIRSRVQDRERRFAVIEAFMAHQFEHEISSARELAEVCLSLDLRKFAPELLEMATAGSGEIEGGRSHVARYVTAFWKEKDAATLGRMWIDWMASKSYDLEGDRFPMIELKKKTEEAVRILPPDVRGKWIEEAIRHHDDFRWADEGAAWLRSLK